jgi:hypothetical protein
MFYTFFVIRNVKINILGEIHLSNNQSNSNGNYERLRWTYCHSLMDDRLLVTYIFYVLELVILMAY